MLTIRKKVLSLIMVSFVLMLVATGLGSYAEDLSTERSKKDVSFPGTVEKAVKRQVNVPIAVNLAVENYDYLRTSFPPQNWQSTGLYAAPREVVKVVVPKGVKGLTIQIGSHTDALTDVKEKDRRRDAKLIVSKELVSGVNTISNPKGGLVYFYATANNTAKSCVVKVSNVVSAPHFVLGKTTNDMWRTIKKSPAPFAELEGKRVILTVPSSYIRNLEDPTKLMKTWDDFVSSADKLAGLSNGVKGVHRAPIAKWRYVADIQLSYGLMYCGYPIMLYADEDIKNMLSVEGFKTRGWGFWHELAHNYQQYNWEVESMVEVTNNIYSLYIEELYNNPSRLLDDNDGTGHSSFEDALVYVNSKDKNKNFHDDKQTTYFTRLVMFWQLKDVYGWEVYTKLFKAFRELPEYTELESDQDKMDQFVIEASKASGNNLLEFFKHWGIGYSDRAISEVTKLKLPSPAKSIWLSRL